MKIAKVIVLLLVLAATSAFAADAKERKFIRDGMSEGDVLMKIGKPDSESEDTGGGAKVTIKRWIYMPTYGDDRTITTIVLERGKVKEVTRQMSR